MSDDTKVRAPQDSSRISLQEDYEVHYWTEKFGISRDQLADAVKAAGHGADAVARHLGKA